jgi:hypothetical protein
MTIPTYNDRKVVSRSASADLHEPPPRAQFQARRDCLGASRQSRRQVKHAVAWIEVTEKSNIDDIEPDTERRLGLAKCEDLTILYLICPETITADAPRRRAVIAHELPKPSRHNKRPWPSRHL